MTYDTQVKQEAPPNHALAQLLEAALLHPESAEGNIRQVIEALNIPAPIVAPVVDDAEDLHLAICQAVHLMNQGDLHAGHDLLRQTLVDYADKKAPLTRTEIIRRQQRSGSGEVSAVMVSPAPASPAALRDEAERACPCLHGEPCQKRCTCVNPHSSSGCWFCCTYGSLEQQRDRAAALRRMILSGIERQHVATTPPSTLARKAAEAIRDWLRTGDGEVDGNAINEVAAIIERCFSGGGEKSVKPD